MVNWDAAVERVKTLRLSDSMNLILTRPELRNGKGKSQQKGEIFSLKIP